MILIDTAGWFALSDNQEKRHDDAKRFFSRITRGEFGRILTTDYILDETYTLLRMRS